jgi:hypothetical protein
MAASLAELTIRDRVRTIERAMLQGGLHPSQVREFISVATALLGWCGRECVEAELAFKSFLAGCRRNCKTAAQARIEAEDSPQYRRLREAQAEQAHCDQIVMSLKAILRSIENEFKGAA